MVATAVRAPTPAARRTGAGLLRSGPMQWLGSISYGIYLWHMVVLEFVIAGPLTVPHRALGIGRLIVLLCAVSAGSAACAAVSWYGIERPLLRARHSPPGVPAASAA
jgi:peptidoglycan/LPS O-acetylase OafA/YrhL